MVMKLLCLLKVYIWTIGQLSLYTIDLKNYLLMSGLEFTGFYVFIEMIEWYTKY